MKKKKIKVNNKSFLYLNITQFLGALNDNFFKWLLIFFLIEHLGIDKESTIITMTTAVFVIPFLLFSDVAGVLADRISKARIVKQVKLAEIIIMTIGFMGFLLKSEYFLYTTLFLMSTQSAVFAPAKYGIIPELVDEKALSKANSLLAMMTFSAIIFGTACVSFLVKSIDGGFVYLSIICIVVACIGYATSLKIENTPSAGSDKKISPWFLLEICRTLRITSKDRYLLTAVLGLSFFWLIGAFLQMQLIPFGREVLGVSKETSGLLFMLVSLGIAIGSLLAGILSGTLIEFGIVPIGATGITFCMLGLYFTQSIFAVGILLFGLGASAGFFTLPLNAFIQWKAPKKKRGEILALVNFLNFVGILCAAGLIFLYGNLFDWSAKSSLAIAGLLTGLLSLIAFVMLPDFIIRLAVLCTTKLMGKTNSKNAKIIPSNGSAIIYCECSSLKEILKIISTQQRRIHFISEKKFCNRGNKWLFKLIKIMLFSSKTSCKIPEENMVKIRKLINAGYIVGIASENTSIAKSIQSILHEEKIIPPAFKAQIKSKKVIFYNS
ncbi:MAG: MFS transporter [Verrucomicrobiota bacterium]|nr:MFS transporter [Verrucomicrobiota bacterium]